MRFSKHRRANAVCRVRRAVLGPFYIKRIMSNCRIYVHASREMSAHLTRRASASFRSSLKNSAYKKIFKSYIKCGLASTGGQTQFAALGAQSWDRFI